MLTQVVIRATSDAKETFGRSRRSRDAQVPVPHYGIIVLQVLIKSRALSAEYLLGVTALSAECIEVRKICRALSAECTQGPECTVLSVSEQLIQVHGSKSFKHILPMHVLHMLFCKPQKLLVHDPMATHDQQAAP